MSIAKKDGGSMPRPQIFNPSDKRVCVKTIRYILKRQSHMSQAIEVDTDVSPPNISSISRDYYNEESKLAMERIVQDRIDRQPKEMSTQYSVDDLRSY